MQPMIESSVVLPEPDGPFEGHHLARRHLDRDALQHLDLAATPSSKIFTTSLTDSTGSFMSADLLASQARKTSAGSMVATRRKESMAAPRHMSTVPDEDRRGEARAR